MSIISLRQLKRVSTFWYVSLGFLLVSVPIVMFVHPVSPTLWANEHRTFVLDYFFEYATKVAEWPVVVAAIVLAYSKHWKTGLYVAGFYGLEALSVWIIKMALREPRPSLEVGIGALQQVNHIVIHQYNSFPSGHTAAAFMGFGFLSFMTKNPWLQALCAICAACIAYSRMYLGQHYLRDLMAGELIALCILGIYLWLHKKYPDKGLK